MPNPLRTFWRRVSDGIEIQQLWAQFHAEARVSYALYSKEVAFTRRQGESKVGRVLRVIRGMFWAMMMKLSPGRRLVFLLALLWLALSNISFQIGHTQIHMENVAFWSAVALLVLLSLELADPKRVFLAALQD